MILSPCGRLHPGRFARNLISVANGIESNCAGGRQNISLMVHRASGIF